MIKAIVELVTPVEFHRWEELECSTNLRQRFYCTKCGGVWETPSEWFNGHQPSAFPHQQNEGILCDESGCDEPPTPKDLLTLSEVDTSPVGPSIVSELKVKSESKEKKRR